MIPAPSTGGQKMLNEEVKQVHAIARMIAKEEIALALQAMEAAQVKPAAAPAKKEEKKNGKL
jgi:hypothetical protein